MRITSKGQVTIPQAVRESAGFMPGTDVEFKIEAGGAVKLVKAKPGARTKKTRGQDLTARLRGQGEFAMTADEVVALMRGPTVDVPAPRRK